MEECVSAHLHIGGAPASHRQNGFMPKCPRRPVHFGVAERIVITRGDSLGPGAALLHKSEKSRDTTTQKLRRHGSHERRHWPPQLSEAMERNFPHTQFRDLTRKGAFHHPLTLTLEVMHPGLHQTSAVITAAPGRGDHYRAGYTIHNDENGSVSRDGRKHYAYADRWPVEYDGMGPNDVVVGYRYDDKLKGGDGDDVLFGSAGSDACVVRMVDMGVTMLPSRQSVLADCATNDLTWRLAA